MKNILRMMAIPLCRLIDACLYVSRIFVIHRTGSAVGDQLLMTTMARLIKEQRGFRVIVIGTQAAFFKNNVNILWFVDISSLKPFAKKALRGFLTLPFLRIREAQLKIKGYDSYTNYMKKTQSRIHIIEAHAKGLGLNLDFSGDLSPDIFFNSEERARIKNSKEWPSGQYALIQAQGKTSFTFNKEWSLERFQKVVKQTPEIRWLQIGLATDALLSGVEDWRGKTNLRALALLVEGAQFVLCLESLHNHLAAAVKTHSLMLATGRSPPEHAIYTTTRPITVNQRPECSWCWLSEPCPIAGYPCSLGIPAEEVAALAKKSWQMNTTP